MNTLRAGRLTAALITSLAVAGCVIPLPPSESVTTRHNVGDAVPEAIVIGKTTRADVVSLLGEPDSATADHAVMVFGRNSSRGGALILIPGPPAGVLAMGVADVTDRRLVVRFDAQGIVSEATVERKDCWTAAIGAQHGAGSSSWGESEPCLDVWGRDLTAAPPEDARLPSDEGEVVSFDKSTWVIDAQDYRESDNRIGVLAFTERSLVFLSRGLSFQDPEGSWIKGKPRLPLKPGLKIPYAQIVRIEPKKSAFIRFFVVESTGRRFDLFLTVEPEAKAEELKARVDLWRAAVGRDPLPPMR